MVGDFYYSLNIVKFIILNEDAWMQHVICNKGLVGLAKSWEYESTFYKTRWINKW